MGGSRATIRRSQADAQNSEIKRRYPPTPTPRKLILRRRGCVGLYYRPCPHRWCYCNGCAHLHHTPERANFDVTWYHSFTPHASANQSRPRMMRRAKWAIWAVEWLCLITRRGFGLASSAHPPRFNDHMAGGRNAG